MPVRLLRSPRTVARVESWERAVTVRPAEAGDAPALARLSERDSRTVPAEPLLVAECDGEIVAALSLRDGDVTADPFRRTAEMIELLRCHARGLAHTARTARRKPAPATGPRDLRLAGGCA
jgi:hypothetical protein